MSTIYETFRFSGHLYVHPCPSKWTFLTLPNARRIPLKPPVFRRWALVLASLTIDAQTPKVMDMDIDFFDHYHWLPAPRPTLTDTPFQGPGGPQEQKAL
jgi:hypothetical protein